VSYQIFQNCSILQKLLLSQNNLVGELPDLPLSLKELKVGWNNLS
jgi:hypothetical protein